MDTSSSYTDIDLKDLSCSKIHLTKLSNITLKIVQY